jgi:hypothetical protein
MAPVAIIFSIVFIAHSSPHLIPILVAARANMLTMISTIDLHRQ